MVVYFYYHRNNNVARWERVAFDYPIDCSKAPTDNDLI